VSLFERFGWGRGDGRRKAAEAREVAGDLAGAAELYLEAELPDEAARVLLLRADAEHAPDRRIAFCAAAARTARSEEIQRAALRRKALLSFDVLSARGASAMRSEVLAVARELEDIGEMERAADAYALAEDQDAEVRALTAAGAIERLEDRLRVSMTSAREQREREAVVARIADLDRMAERRAALEAAQRWLAEREDEQVADTARGIRARLLTGPLIDVEEGGAARRCALGDEITIGRGEATIVVASRAVSRTHVRLRRGAAGAELEDLGTRNGTTLAGARLSAPLPIGAGVRVLLGGEVPCAISPRAPANSAGGAGDGAYVVEVAGERYLAPLGDLVAGPWRIRREQVAGEAFVVLRTPRGAPPPFLADLQLAAAVELCAGDALSASRGGPIALRLLGAPRGEAPQDSPSRPQRGSW
jgi:hypothetical protein